MIMLSQLQEHLTNRDIARSNMESIQQFIPANPQEAYSKTLYVIMKCRTEEQLNSAERYLRNYERLMQNSHLYPNISKPFANRTVNDLLSLLKLKRKEYIDF